MLMRNLGFALAGLALLASAAVAVAAATPSPRATVQSAVDEVLRIVHDKSVSTAVRRDRIREVIGKYFDFYSMSQRVLGPNWQKATPNEREGFVGYFSDYLEHTYARVIDRHTNEVVEYGAEKVDGNRAQVDTLVVTKTAKAPVNYRLRFDKDTQKWYAYDVVIEGVSLVSSYRDVFGAIVASDGMDGLILDLQQRLDKAKQDPPLVQ